MMIKGYVGLAAVALATGTPATAAPVDDAVATIATTLDKFNGGDADAFVNAHQDGALIVDEFAPYVWGGSGSVQKWLGDYGKDAGARGISGGRIDYGKPIQANATSGAAYVVMPTTYRFTQGGKKMAGAGSMTFVMARRGGEWKISSWTYSGATPTPER